MIQGIYTASRGMSPLLEQQNQIANNLANVNTTGFKQSGLFTKSYSKIVGNDCLQPFANSDITVDEVYIDYREGPMKKSTSPFDLLIKGRGFFTLMTDNGIEYTRNGNFSLDPDGFLVASDGAKVMGNEGFIRVERDLAVTISEDGEIIQNGEVRDALKVIDFEIPYNFERTGENRFRPIPSDTVGNVAVEKKSTGFSVRQGYLEGSNVDMIRNMVKMISLYRNFEADQKALQAQDETLDKAVNQVGRVG